MVFVLNRDGKPLMPTCARTARRLLAGGKARVVHTTPFTIRLLYGSTGYRQTVVAGLDAGSGVIGCAATANGCVVYQAEVSLRSDISNPDVTGAGYRAGKLKDFYNVKQYVLHRDGYACQSGQKIRHSPQLQVHHKQFRSNGGPDTAENLVTLCKTCHIDLHAGKFDFRDKGKRSKTRHAAHMGIVKARLSQCAIAHTARFGYETKYQREQLLTWPKTHANDAVAICLDDGESVSPLERILVKRHISKGDYKQTAGRHSQLPVPTGKLFGLRKGDKVATSRGTGFIKGKRSTGYFAIADLDGTILHASEKVAHCRRLTARTTTQVEELSLLALSARRTEKQWCMQAAKETKAAESAMPAPVLSGLKAEVSRSKF